MHQPQPWHQLLAPEPDLQSLAASPSVRHKKRLHHGNLSAFLEELDKRHAQQEAKLNSYNKRIDKLQRDQASIQQEVSIITLSQDSYQHRRNYFLSMFKRDNLCSMNETDRKILAEGNLFAEGGDAVVDSMLYYTGSGGRRDVKTFETLYGLLPETVQRISHTETLEVLNMHAGVLSSNYKSGSATFYRLFEDFLKQFKEWGMGYEVDYLMGTPTPVTGAYWAFVKCSSTDVARVKGSA
ncbi:hypothetical protein HOY82DRAFT_521783 [Tuber indicum]|nr:hypothetical protein HOY82DRAFT_521783 [Tuber indicum]